MIKIIQSLKNIPSLLNLLLTPPIRSFHLFCYTYFGVVWIGLFSILRIGGSIGITPLCAIADAYFLSLLSVVGGKWLRNVLFGVIGLFFLIENYVIFTYECQINSTLIGLVLQTDSRESSEFLVGCFTSSYFWVSVGVFILFTFLFAWLIPLCFKKSFLRIRLRFNRGNSNLFPKLRSYIKFVVAGLIILACVRETKYYYRQFNLLNVNSLQEVESEGGIVSCTPWMRLIQAGLMQVVMKKEIILLDKTLENTKVKSVNYKSPIILLIIGESYNKYFTPLYNSQAMPTTPNLCRLVEEKQLTVFSDVVSASNLTSQVFRYFFTLSKPFDSKWMTYPTFPALFKKAGYNVFFISNQFIQDNVKESHFDQIGNILLNYGNLSINQFSYRNKRLSKYDGSLLNMIPSVDSLVSTGNPLLMIVHLLGQHMEYSERYPLKSDKFSKDDIKDGVGGEIGRKVRAHYANAVYYNDSVVGEIFKMFKPYETIGIYLSDHGEEVYDYRSFRGRSHSPYITPLLAKYEYEVPFFVYASPSYRQKHPDVIKLIEGSQYLPYYTADLSHTLLDLAGIKCKEYDVRRALFSGKYDHQRKRILNSKIDYDSLMSTIHFK